MHRQLQRPADANEYPARSAKTAPCLQAGTSNGTGWSTLILHQKRLVFCAAAGQ